MKRVHLWAGVAVVVVVGAGALVYGSVPHTFATGDTLQAADLNSNFTALDQRTTALEAASTHWDGFLNKGGGLSTTTLSGTMAHVTFTPPATGNLVVRARFSTAVRNNFDTILGDCYVISQISTSPTAPTLNAASGTLGVSELYVVATLPTQSGAGTYQWFPQGAEEAFAATAGTPLTVYLNGAMSSSCRAVAYFDVAISADFVATKGTVTVTAN
jgi:hypothetical protein